MKEGAFPLGVAVSPRRTAWVEDEIETWLAETSLNRTTGPETHAATVGVGEGDG